MSFGPSEKNVDAGFHGCVLRGTLDLCSGKRRHLHSPFLHLPRPCMRDGEPPASLIDELFTAWPFLGSRRLAVMLRGKGYSINRKRVQRLMRQMGIAALVPNPRTAQPAARPKTFP